MGGWGAGWGQVQGEMHAVSSSRRGACVTATHALDHAARHDDALAAWAVGTLAACAEVQDSCNPQKAHLLATVLQHAHRQPAMTRLPLAANWRTNSAPMPRLPAVDRCGPRHEQESMRRGSCGSRM